MKLTPPCPNVRVEKGYLHLPPRWICQNPSFTLSIPLTPRWLIQDVNATTHGLLTLARGPVIYCVEDVDNVWVQDHFKVGQSCAFSILNVSVR